MPVKIWRASKNCYKSRKPINFQRAEGVAAWRTALQPSARLVGSKKTQRYNEQRWAFAPLFAQNQRYFLSQSKSL
jgi:hypothetical protein